MKTEQEEAMERRVEAPGKCANCGAVGVACCLAAAHLAEDVEKLKDHRERTIRVLGAVAARHAEIVALLDACMVGNIRNAWKIDVDGLLIERVEDADAVHSKAQTDILLLLRTLKTIKEIVEKPNEATQ